MAIFFQKKQKITKKTKAVVLLSLLNFNQYEDEYIVLHLKITHNLRPLCSRDKDHQTVNVCKD